MKHCASSTHRMNAPDKTQRLADRQTNKRTYLCVSWFFVCLRWCLTLAQPKHLRNSVEGSSAVNACIGFSPRVHRANQCTCCTINSGEFAPCLCDVSSCKCGYNCLLFFSVTHSTLLLQFCCRSEKLAFLKTYSYKMTTAIACRPNCVG